MLFVQGCEKLVKFEQFRRLVKDNLQGYLKTTIKSMLTVKPISSQSSYGLGDGISSHFQEKCTPAQPAASADAASAKAAAAPPPSVARTNSRASISRSSISSATGGQDSGMGSSSTLTGGSNQAGASGRSQQQATGNRSSAGASAQGATAKNNASPARRRHDSQGRLLCAHKSVISFLFYFL